MALPALYRNVTLTSYPHIRFRDQGAIEAEGCGSASPFALGLAALVTQPNVGPMVRELCLRGHWRQDDLEIHARVGRVPEATMMLNIAVRAALDRTQDLEAFSWRLVDTKPLDTVYVGLTRLPRLERLTLRFPGSRHPRPTTLVPPMPQLRWLKVTHIDPLCYPDDISLLLAQSPRLHHLKMHWSPRMKCEQEATIRMSDYFRRCTTDKTKLRLKSLAFQNFYALLTDEGKPVDVTQLEDLAFLDSPGCSDGSVTSFVESSWSKICDEHPNVKVLRHDRVDKRFCDVLLPSFGALEKIYFVTPIFDRQDRINRVRDSPEYPEDELQVPNSNSSSPSIAPPSLSTQLLLRDSYLRSVTGIHGWRLKHLLLTSRWTLTTQMIVRLVRACPNLEQLAFATEQSSLDSFALLLPFLRKLEALRLLIPTPIHALAGRQMTPASYEDAKADGLGIPSRETITQIVDLYDQMQTAHLSENLADKEIFSNLRIVGLGWKAWQLDEFYTIPASERCRISSDGVYENFNNSTTPEGVIAHSSVSSPIKSARPRLSSVHSDADAYELTSKRRRLNETAVSSLPSASADEARPCSRLALDVWRARQAPKRTPESDVRAPVGQPTREATYEPTHEQSVEWGLILDNLVHDSISLDGLEGEKEEPMVWRRRVRPVGWDVLRHWEIWALDVQEI